MTKKKTQARKAAEKAHKKPESETLTKKQELQQALFGPSARDIFGMGGIDIRHVDEMMEPREPVKPRDPNQETIFDRYPELSLAKELDSKIRRLASTEGGRFADTWLGLETKQRRRIMEDALRFAFAASLGDKKSMELMKIARKGWPTLTNRFMATDGFVMGTGDATEKIDILPTIFAPIDLEQFSKNPDNFVRVVHARAYNGLESWLRADYVRIIEPALEKWDKISRGELVVKREPGVPPDRKSFVQIVENVAFFDVRIGDIFWMTEEHIRYQTANRFTTGIHPEQARWVFAFEIVVLDFIQRTMMAVLTLEGDENTGRLDQQSDVNPGSREEALQSLLFGLSPRPYLPPILDVCTLDASPRFHFSGMMDFCLASCREATDKLYMLQHHPSFLILSVKQRLELRGEPKLDIVAAEVHNTIFSGYMRASIWGRVCTILEEITDFRLYGERDDQHLTAVHELLVYLLNEVGLDMETHVGMAQKLRKHLSKVPTAEPGKTQLRFNKPASEIYRTDPVMALLMLMSKVFRRDKDFAWANRVYQFRTVVEEVQRLFEKDPSLENDLPQFVLTGLAELGQIYHVLDVIKLHRMELPASGDSDTMITAVSLQSNLHELQKMIKKVDMTAILRTGSEALSNLNNYLMTTNEDGSQIENVKNLENFWKFFEMKMKGACGYTLQYWFKRCGYEIVFPEPRGFWHPNEGGAWLGDCLDVDPKEPGKVNVTYELGNLRPKRSPVRERLTDETGLAKMLKELLLLRDSPEPLDRVDEYDPSKCWPGLIGKEAFDARKGAEVMFYKRYPNEQARSIIEFHQPEDLKVADNGVAEGFEYFLSNEVTSFEVLDAGQPEPAGTPVAVPNPYIKFDSVETKEAWIQSQILRNIPLNVQARDGNDLILEFLPEQDGNCGPPAETLMNFVFKESSFWEYRDIKAALMEFDRPKDKIDLAAEEVEFWKPLENVSEADQRFLDGLETKGGVFQAGAEHIPFKNPDGSVTTNYLAAHPRRPVIAETFHEDGEYLLANAVKILELDGKDKPGLYPFPPPYSAGDADRHLILTRKIHCYSTPSRNDEEWELANVSEEGYWVLYRLRDGIVVPWDDFCWTMEELGFSIEKVCANKWYFRPAAGLDESMLIENTESEMKRIWMRLQAAYGFQMKLFWCRAWEAEEH